MTLSLLRKLFGKDIEYSAREESLHDALNHNTASEEELQEMFPSSSIPKHLNRELQDFLHKASPHVSTVFASNNLIKFQSNLHFLKDSKFTHTHQQLYGNDSMDGTWLAHVQIWAAQQALKVEGDFMELGVHAGTSAAYVYRYLDMNNSKRKFYLYDTFSGLSEYDPNDHSKAYFKILQDHYGKSEHYERVLRLFKDCPNAVIVVGSIPETLHAKSPEKIAYLHLDLNAAKPEIAALEILWDRMPAGAVILLDDFGTLYDNQTRSHLKFMKSKNIPILEIPTGQGLAIKS